MKKNYFLAALFIVLSLFGNQLSAQTLLDKDYLQTLDQNNLLEVVIAFEGDGPPSPVHLQLLQQLDINLGVTMQALPIAGVLATPAQVAALLDQPEVLSVVENTPLSYYNENGTQLTGVDRLRGDKGITAQNGGLPVSGKGIGVLINDSGVDGTHDDHKLGNNLVQNVLGSTNLNSYSALLPITYLENQPNTDSNSGHGTHCAGTVGGNGAKSAGKYEGVAPGAHLLGYGSGGVLFILDAVGGLDYALTHQFEYNIRVINNSWGTSGPFNPEHPVNIATKRLYDRGIINVFAAGNDGPGADTHNPYAIAPWVISVAAGDKYGRLASFSSRGVKDQTFSFTIDGESWVAENQPTVTAPGVDVVSTRAVAPLGALAAEQDAELDPAHAPYYSHMSGTSMASPHVAGIVALMLEANPALSPAEVREVLQLTATNMPGRADWEVGAGYVNAYAAIDHIFNQRNYGTAQNYNRKFNSEVYTSSTIDNWTIDFNPVALLSADNNEYTFYVQDGVNSLEAKMMAGGLLGETGNPVNMSLISPDGTEYRSGIYVAFTLNQDRTVAVASPIPGQWKVKISGLEGVALPESIEGMLTIESTTGSSGLDDIAGHAAEASILMAVSNRLADGRRDGFKPDDDLKRIELADYLMMGQGIRQHLPTNGAVTFSDLKGEEILIGESVAARGAALRDRSHANRGVVLATDGKFSPNAKVNRAELAYSMVQSLGLEEEALKLNGQGVTVSYQGERIAIDDAADIPEGLEGYVQIALDLQLINAIYSIEQKPFALKPTIQTRFEPLHSLSRAEFAVIITRTFDHWDAASGYSQEDASARTVGHHETESLDAAPAMPVLQNFPNPFRQSTKIEYYLEEDTYVELTVYTLNGEKVATLVQETRPAGKHAAEFNAGKLKSGMYFCRISTGNQDRSIKLMVE